MEQLSDLVATLTASPLLPLVVLAVCIVDGFFPPVPSEMTVVAALAGALAGTGTWLWAAAIVAAAAVGAIVGDSIAFAAGRRIGVDRFGWMRRPRVRRMTGWITERVHTSPATIVLVGRYIPAGRVAVNAIAGASGLRYRRFFALASLAGTVWAVTCLVVSLASAALLTDPLWSALLAVAVTLVLGLGIDHVTRQHVRSAA